MLERKRLLASGDIAKGYVAYPAKLMTAAKKSDTNYILKQDFSKNEVKLRVVQSGVDEAA